MTADLSAGPAPYLGNRASFPVLLRTGALPVTLETKKSRRPADQVAAAGVGSAVGAAGRRTTSTASSAAASAAPTTLRAA
jgi:hypothetical protein